ncbi:MAG TPA: SRPBCC family protein [Pseudonocardiaceae bacterium]
MHETVRLDRAFTLPVGPDRAFEVLTDAAQVAAAVPGAALASWDGTTFHASVRLRLGLLPVVGHGVGRMELRDPERKLVRVEVNRRDGEWVASVALAVRPGEDGDSLVRVRADLRAPSTGGRIARSMVAEVGARMVTSASAALATSLGDEAPDPAATAAKAPEHTGLAGAVEVAAGVTLGVVRGLFGRKDP